MPYLLDIEELGYSLVRCELAVFKLWARGLGRGPASG